MTALPWQVRDQLLLSDSNRWGRGYGGISYSNADLQETVRLIAETMRRGGLSGYEMRGPINQYSGVRAGTYEFILPAGFDADSPDRRDVRDPLLLEPNNPTSPTVLWHVLPSVRDYYMACGLPIDQHGRAVHPLAERMMHAGIPLCTGYGVGREGGETIVVDTVVTDGESTLFTTCENYGKTIPSLVCGRTRGADFTSLPEWRVGLRPVGEEGIFRAARRIVRAKARLHLPEDASYEIVRGVRPWDPYTTLNFWNLIYTVRIQLESGTARRFVPADNAFWASGSELGDIRANLRQDHRHGYDAAVR